MGLNHERDQVPVESCTWGWAFPRTVPKLLIWQLLVVLSTKIREATGVNLIESLQNHQESEAIVIFLNSERSKQVYWN